MATEKVVYELSLRDLMTKGLNDINTKMGQLEGKIQSTQTKTTTATKSMGSAFSGLNGIMAAVTATRILAIGKESLDTAAKLEGLSKAIVFSSGSSEEGAKNLGFLHDVTRSMPIDLMAAMEGFKTFNGAVMGSALEGDKARGIFLQVAKAASVMKLNGEDTTAMFLAMGQMVSKGTVQAEELKGQLGERLPGAFQQVAKSMGVTTSKLGDMMKAGEITAEEMLPKLANQLNLTYSKGMGDANDSIQAHQTRLSNLKLEMIEGSIPTMKKLMGAFTETAFAIKDNWEPIAVFFESWTFMFTDMVDITSRFFGVFGVDKQDVVLLFFKSLMTVLQALMTPMQLIFAQFASIADIITSIASGNTEGLMGRITDRFKSPFAKFGEIWNAETNTGGPLGEAFLNADKMLGTTDSAAGLADAKKKEKLKKQSESVSGGVPKVVNINIEALMKDVQVFLGNGDMNTAPANDFLDKLSRALNTVVEDVGIVAQYGR